MALAGGVLYVADQGYGPFAFRTDCATDGGTCEPLWRAFVPEALSSSPPVVSAGLVYFGSQGGEVYAFPVGCSDPCSPVWSRSDASNPNSWVGVAVTANRVYVGATNYGLLAYGLKPKPVPASHGPLDPWSAVVYAIAVLVGLGVVATHIRDRRIEHNG